MARCSLYLATLSMVILTGYVSCWDLLISTTESWSWDKKRFWRHNIAVSCHATGVTNCQFKFYNYERQTSGGIIDCSTGGYTDFWEDSKVAWCGAGNHDPCVIKFWKDQVNSGRYVVGCRAKNSGGRGGWKYNYTTIFSHNAELYDRPMTNISIVEPGTKFTFHFRFLVAGRPTPINQCVWSMPDKHYNDQEDFSQGHASSKTARYSYDDESLQQGICSITLHNVSEGDNGIVWCLMNSQDGELIVETLALIVAKPPTNVTLTLKRDQELKSAFATCSVSPSRPVASIKWLLNGSAIKQDWIQERITHTWIWPWEEQPIVQTLTIPRGNENDNITCKVLHNNNTIFIKTENFGTSSYTPPGVIPLNNSQGHQDVTTGGYGPSSDTTLADETPDLPPVSTMHAMLDIPVGFVISISIGSLICLLIVAIVAYSTWKRRYCFAEHSTAVLMTSPDGAANEEGTANQNRATIGEPSVVYSEVNKEPTMSKKVNSGAANEKGSVKKKGSTIEEASVIYAVVNKEQKNKKKAPLGAPNQKGTKKEEASVIYSVVNKETKIKKKSTPGTSAPADSSVIYAEIVNKNAGKPAGKLKAALPQENVEYTDLGWN